MHISSRNNVVTSFLNSSNVQLKVEIMRVFIKKGANCPYCRSNFIKGFLFASYYLVGILELLIAIFLMINYYKDAWKKAFQFKGVANRKEYWFFVLANILVTIIINLIIGIFNFLGISLLSQIIGTIFPVFVIGSLIVNISISVRR